MPNTTIDDLVVLASISGKDKVVDLGCGDGRVLIHLCKSLGCTGRGCDIDQSLINIASSTTKRMNVSTCTFQNDDVLKFPLEDSTIIILFLTPNVLKSLMNRLCQIIRKQKHIKIVSYHFPIKFLGKPKQIKETRHFLPSTKKTTNLYLYCR